MSGSIGVPGRTAMLARAPSRRSSRASRTGAAAASAWKVTDSHPISAYTGAQVSGSSIMRCASIGIGDTARMRSTTGGPNVRFGTKWLSMTSTCAMSALLMRLSSPARSAKSAERMLGLMCMPTRPP